MGGVTKAAFFCHKTQNLRTSLGAYKYLKLLEVFAEDLTHGKGSYSGQPSSTSCQDEIHLL